MGSLNMAAEVVFWRSKEHFRASDALQNNHDHCEFLRAIPCSVVN